MLLKPYSAARLLARVAEWLAPPPAAEAGPLASSLGEGSAAWPRLADYVTNLKKLQIVLSAAVREGQVERCRAACLPLRGSAAGHGFAVIAEAAGEALGRLSSPAGGLEEARPSLEKLAGLCGRACVEPRAAA